MKKELLRFSTAGSVDDGKSTLIGRLLLDSKNIFEDHLASVKKASTNDSLDLFLFTDGLKAEREQKITIDVAYRFFSTLKRKFIIADSPGHEQYTRNMATGASTANLAIILIDARKGILQQSKRHAFIVSLLQVPHMIVAINKMDLVDYSQEIFNNIKQEFTEFAARLDIQDLQFIPLSALTGENVTKQSEKMSWYRGDSLLGILENVHIASDLNLIDFRFPVQYVNNAKDFRGYSGTIFSGMIKKGDSIMVLPSLQKSRIKSIITYDGELEKATAPMAITILLEDEIDISRGDMLVHQHNVPNIQRCFEAMIVWTNEIPLDLEKSYYLKHCNKTTRVRIENIHYKIDVNTLCRTSDKSAFKMNEIGRLVFAANQSLFFDTYQKNRSTGSFVLIDTLNNTTVAAGTIIDREPNLTNENQESTQQHGITLWFTGLSGSGKSTLADALQKDIQRSGLLCCNLDGDILRKGLCSDLGFSIKDRCENIRRVAEVATFLNKTKIIVLTSLISPFKKERDQAKSIIGVDNFIEIFVDTPLELCERRDPKGLYKKVRNGEIKDFTGIDSPYEIPINPDLRLLTEELSVEQCIKKIKDCIFKKFNLQL